MSLLSLCALNRTLLERQILVGHLVMLMRDGGEA
jgi:hypothetical protein